jgi:hypothetical protein
MTESNRRRDTQKRSGHDAIEQRQLSEEDPPDRGTFSLYIELGRASSKDVQRVLSALNELDFAAGGMGFIFELADDEGPRPIARLRPQGSA